ARHPQDPAGLTGGGVAVQQFPREGVDVLDAAAQVDRLSTPTQGPGTGGPPGVVGAVEPVGHVPGSERSHQRRSGNVRQARWGGLLSTVVAVWGRAPVWL